MQPKKKNIFSMYRVLFLAVTLPLIVCYFRRKRRIYGRNNGNNH